MLDDPATPGEVRAILGRVEDVRAFAADLGLEVGGQYTSYVDWPGDRVVTTLVRTREDSLETVAWHYPILGALPYKGFFEQERAEREAERLRDDAYQVCVSGVSAYSTLGWLDDPVTQPMIARGPALFVETLFHELVHATAFVSGDADFNEGVAQFIGQQAAIRFFEQNAPNEDSPESWPDAARVRGGIADRTRVAELTLAFKDALLELEGAQDRARRRLAAEAALRAEIAALPLTVYDPARVAAGARLSDPCVALRGTYVRDAPRHAAVLDALEGSLPAMIERLKRWVREEREVEAFFDVSQGASSLADGADASAAVPPSDR